MKSIAIWINNCLSYNNILDKMIIKHNYENEYKNNMYNHYLNYFINYYKQYFYDYFNNELQLKCKELITALSSEDIQQQIFNLSIEKTQEKINDLDFNKDFNKYLNENKDYQNEINNIDCYNRLNEMINQSITLFKKNNKLTKTILIEYGTKMNINADECIYNGILDINKFEFTKNYNHYSTNSYDYELFCFLRWFIIKDYINSLDEEYDRIYIFDNDTLIFDNLDNYDFDMTHNPYMSYCGCPAFTIINKKLLNDLCDTILNIFKDNDEECINFSKIHAGVISDMGIFSYLHSKNKIYEVNEYKFKPYFIINIGSLIINDKLPYYNIVNNKLYIENNQSNCIGIHFAGKNKKYIRQLYEAAI